MKIAVFVGSNRGKASNEYKLAQLYLENVVNLGLVQNVQSSIICLSEFSLSMVSGDTKMFTEDLLSKNSKISELYKPLITADVLVFTSPVYFHAVSAIQKNFIEHLTPLAHIFGLAGKRGVVLVSCSSNGSEYVHSYLNKFFTYTGVGIVGGFEFKESEWSLESNLVSQTIHDLAVDTLSAHKTANMKITKKQETIFKQFKLKYQDSKFNNNIEDSYELTVWNKSEISNCKSLEEYARKRTTW